MKRFSSLLSRNKGESNKTGRTFSTSDLDNALPDSAEGKASHAIRAFCENGDPNNREDEVLHLPAIVDAAEASPSAAAACAVQIRSYMHKSYFSKPHTQYNAIMLIRILSDHPGESFTKNFDDKFVKVTKALLRDSKDKSVQQLLRETLDSLEVNRMADPGCQGLITMWIREKGLAMRYAPVVQTQSQSPALPARPSRSKLPTHEELASRVEESKNSAKILIQFLQTTPPEEVSSNELIREFSDRCLQAQRSMQNYISCDNPPPDDDTLQTLIETNEQLSLAYSRYQRAVLAGRRAAGPPSPNVHPERASSVSPTPQIYAPVPRLPQPSIAPQQSPAPQLPQTVPFGSLTNGTHYDRSFVARESNVSPVSPPQTYVQPVTTHIHHEDEDDLYDSPKATRAPESNPFADPRDQASDRVYPAAQPLITSDSLSASRPSPAPWHNSTITPSFLGRQASAVGGITMHAPGSTTPSEIDGHSGVGRTDYRDVPGRSDNQTSFSVTGAPVLSSNRV